MNFDPEAAKDLYSQKRSEELVRIALLEPEYLPEARSLAEQELTRRQISDADRQVILERLKENDEEAETDLFTKASLAYEIPNPLLNLTYARKRIIWIILGTLPVIGTASAELGWNLFFGYDRWVAALGFAAFVVFGYRVGPSGKEFREHVSKRRPTK